MKNSATRTWWGALFRLYRRTVSPVIGQACRFEPSCSRYSEEAFARFGFIRGLVLTCWRLFRCQPFTKGGLDPVPDTFCGCKSAPRRIT